MTRVTGRRRGTAGQAAGEEEPEARHLAPRESGLGASARSIWPRFRHAALEALWRPLAILVAARVAMEIGIFTFSHIFHRYTFNPWDGGWYVYAAQHGWPHHVRPGLGDAGQDTLAFFPAFPTVIRVVHFLLPLTWNRAGEVAAFLTEVAMVIGIWLLARDIWGRAVADRGIVLVCFFPGAFILAMMYSEPLLIAAAAFCFLALRRRQWVLAGVLAAVGGVTRVIGLALVVACIWEAARALRRDRDWRSLAAVVISPLGVVAWFAYLWALTGDSRAWFDTERNGWAQHTTIKAIPDLIRSVADTHPVNINQVLALAGTGLGILLLGVLIASRAPSVLTVYSIAVLVVSATSVNPAGIRFRFVLTAFPLVVVVGRYLKDAALGVAIGASSLLMGIILVVTLMGPPLIP